jgi:hypothetical protein
MITKKLKLEDQYLAHSALLNVGEQDMLLGTQYQFEDLIEAIEKNAKRFGTEKQKLLDEYGTLVPGTNIYNVESEEYSEKLEKLKAISVEVSFTPLDSLQLEREGIRIKGSDLRSLKEHFITRLDKNDKIGNKDEKKTGSKNK